jgi:histidinol-phosphate phosphatase family protein
MRPEDVRLIDGASGGLRRLAAAGFLLVVVSNQGAYAKGKVGLRSLWLAHDRFQELLAQEGVALDDVYYSFSHPDGIAPHFSGPSIDRKPSPYQLLVAAARLDVDLTRSWMIGDRETDVMCGHAAGTRAVRIMVDEEDEPASKAEIVTRDLASAAERILAG